MIASLVTAMLLQGSSSWAAVPQEIQVPTKLRNTLKSFEPSAGLYLSDLDAYLIASDDTTKKDQAILFLMNEQGQIDANPVGIQGLDKMTDIESLSQDEAGHLYALSSQSLNKSGKNKPERNLLVRAERRGRELRAESQIELRPLLLSALSQSLDPQLRDMTSRYAAELDIESHLVRDGHLYLGLKNPQPRPGQAVVIRVESVDDLLRQGEVRLSTWKTVNFKAISGEDDLLSEMLQIGDDWILTTSTEAETGRLWRYDQTTEQLTLLEEFEGFKAEGTALNPDSQDLLVLFDMGEEPARFQFVDRPRLGLR